MTPAPDLNVVEWAEEYRKLSKESSNGGKFVTARVEVARGPMLAATEPGVATITLMACTQLLKTTVIENIAVGVLQASAATMVAYIYGRDAWIALRTRNPKRTDFLIVGIVLAWLSTDGQAILAVLFRLAGMPTWFVNSEIYAPIRLLSVVAAVLHVSAPGAVDGLVPRRNRIAMGIGLGGAMLPVLVLLWSRPDVGPLLERTRPYISDFFQTGASLPAGAPPV